MVAGYKLNLASIITLISIGLFTILIAWIAPIYLTKIEERIDEVTYDSNDRYTRESSIRQMILQIFAGLAVVSGVAISWKQLELSREHQITERFTRAIELLGNEKQSTRIGGIYALERIAHDSLKDHWNVMEILTAYIREFSPRNDRKHDEKVKDPGLHYVTIVPNTDIQAILTVISRRSERGVQIEKTNGYKIDLYKTDLRGCDLYGADLHNAILERSDFEKANLARAKLNGANLKQCDLDGADFCNATFDGTQFALNSMNGTKFFGSNLRGAKNLEFQSLRHIEYDDTTVFPESIDRIVLDENNSYKKSERSRRRVFATKTDIKDSEGKETTPDD